MAKSPFLSLIVPTRERPEQLQRFLDSVSGTVDRKDDIEILLVVDADDNTSTNIRCDDLSLEHVVVPPGQTMGALNMAGYEASCGSYIMLLNDDVIVRTKGWDTRVRTVLRCFRDGIVLAHVNDTLFQRGLCTFPLVSRTWCEFAGGICPRDYKRYRIDDHIEDVFNMLAVLGKKRSVYFPDLVFEHCNLSEDGQGNKVYLSDPAITQEDHVVFRSYDEERKELVVRLYEHIDGPLDAETRSTIRAKLAGLVDPFALRVEGRQRTQRSAWVRSAVQRLTRPGAVQDWLANVGERVRHCFHTKGVRGLIDALSRRA